MNKRTSVSKLLGIAFLLQGITSLVSGAIIRQSLIVPGNITESLIKIARNPTLMRVHILADMITALGIIFLGAMLFTALKKQNEKIALIALGFYILEASLLAVSRMGAFILLRVSQIYVTTGQPDDLRLLGSLALESMDFTGTTLHMLVFCLGAILFYYLLYKSEVIPHALSLWGLLTVSVALVATLLTFFGYEVPFIVYVPYAPFEFVVGIWILVKGLNGSLAIEQQLAPA